MTFLEALYGSQYFELEQRGRDGKKGRLNGNILLSVMIMLGLFALLLLSITVIPGFESDITRLFRRTFGISSGRSTGKLLAIPMMGLIYICVALTAGSRENFQKKVEAFSQYPDEEKKKANKKLMIPFFILLALVFFLSVTRL